MLKKPSLITSSLSNRRDGGDRVLLTMTNRAAIAFAALRLEIDRFDAALDADDRKGHLCAFNIGRSDFERRAVRNGADGIESNFLALFGLDLFNLDRISNLDKHLHLKYTHGG